MQEPLPDDDKTKNWYLFIGESICLKVPSTLSIGEDLEGQISLNPKEHQQVLLRVYCDKSGRLLMETSRNTLALDWEAGSASVVNDQLSLLSATRILLPHNELYFNQEMERGRVHANIVMRDLADKTETSEPVSLKLDELELDDLEVEALEPEEETVVLSAPTELQPIQTAAIEAHEHTSEQLIKDADLFTEPKVMDTQPETRSSHKKWKVMVPVTVIGAALGAVIGYPYLVPEKPLPKEVANVSSTVTEDPSPVPFKEPIVAPQTPRVLEEEPSYKPLQADVEPVSTETEFQPTPDADEALAVKEDIGLQDSIDTQGLAVNLKEEDLSQADIPVDPQTARRLARARKYFDQGFIISPLEANAVKELSNILYVDPTNQEALNLMSDSANKLVSAAVEAYSAGLEYEARNLLEEVLAFHPEHAKANEYWQEWTN